MFTDTKILQLDFKHNIFIVNIFASFKIAIKAKFKRSTVYHF